jgi:predicted  nucleic acid-binding Zn-ribbon protein
VDKCSPLCYNKRVVRKANKKQLGGIKMTTKTLTAAQETYFEVIENKHKLQKMYMQHSEFYQEVLWIYSSETLEALQGELKKLKYHIANCELTLKDMRSEHGWSREELKEMKKAFATWTK